jgi:hypothetical protein
MHVRGGVQEHVGEDTVLPAYLFDWCRASLCTIYSWKVDFTECALDSSTRSHKPTNTNQMYFGSAVSAYMYYAECGFVGRFDPKDEPERPNLLMMPIKFPRA